MFNFFAFFFRFVPFRFVSFDVLFVALFFTVSYRFVPFKFLFSLSLSQTKKINTRGIYALNDTLKHAHAYKIHCTDWLWYVAIIIMIIDQSIGRLIYADARTFTHKQYYIWSSRRRQRYLFTKNVCFIQFFSFLWLILIMLLLISSNVTKKTVFTVSFNWWSLEKKFHNMLKMIAK